MFLLSCGQKARLNVYESLKNQPFSHVLLAFPFLQDAFLSPGVNKGLHETNKQKSIYQLLFQRNLLEVPLKKESEEILL